MAKPEAWQQPATIMLRLPLQVVCDLFSDGKYDGDMQTLCVGGGGGGQSQESIAASHYAEGANP